MQFINNDKNEKGLDSPTDQISDYLHKNKKLSLEMNESNGTRENSINNTTTVDIPTTTSSTVLPYELKTYPQAWIALLLLVLLRTAVSVFQFTFSVVPTITSQYFDVSLSAINWLANVQCIVYVIISFFTGFIFEKLGVKRSVIYLPIHKRTRIS